MRPSGPQAPGGRSGTRPGAWDARRGALRAHRRDPAAARACRGGGVARALSGAPNGSWRASSYGTGMRLMNVCPCGSRTSISTIGRSWSETPRAPTTAGCRSPRPYTRPARAPGPCISGYARQGRARNPPPGQLAGLPGGRRARARREPRAPAQVGGGRRSRRARRSWRSTRATRSCSASGTKTAARASTTGPASCSLSEGGKLEDPAGFVHRLNEMFLAMAGGAASPPHEAEETR